VGSPSGSLSGALGGGWVRFKFGLVFMQVGGTRQMTVHHMYLSTVSTLIYNITIRAEGVLPSIKLEQPSLPFPPTFVGSAARLPLTLVNTTAVPATLVCDLTGLVDFELLLSSECWSALL